ncbi:conserved hypothetical protein [Ricinus communis]|uniref:Presenilin n=1 Tax=Ricinus communis TaxID=3988 RepID=B9RLN5_RICCO|nr:conserved hypothetical protein [Ricinus communis]
MAQNQRPRSIIDSLGEEIIRIITPVSICMLIVVVLVSILNETDNSSTSTTINTIATIAYTETSSDSLWDKLKGALLNSLVFVAVVTVVTFVLAYLVVIGVLVAYWFTLLPEWTTWALLVAMALYDLAAVLLPVGPLRLLVELAISRDEDIPALVYEARPVAGHDSGSTNGVAQRRVWRGRRNVGDGSEENLDSNLSSGTVSSVDSGHHTTRLLRAEEGQVSETEAELSAPLIDRRSTHQLHVQGDAASSENLLLEGIGLGSTGAIKLGLGDFIFYSVLVGRAAMYDFMTVYACYLAIIAGLGITLLLLAFYQKALPALPVSIALGTLTSQKSFGSQRCRVSNYESHFRIAKFGEGKT